MAHILIAEDDKAMRDFLTMALHRAGHSTTVCSDGQEALTVLQNTTDSGRPYDLLLTDIVMPGMDGIELSQKAMALYPAIKVMFITGFAATLPEEDDSRLLPKPFHLKDLIGQVDRLLTT